MAEVTDEELQLHSGRAVDEHGVDRSLSRPQLPP